MKEFLCFCLFYAWMMVLKCLITLHIHSACSPGCVGVNQKIHLSKCWHMIYIFLSLDLLWLHHKYPQKVNNSIRVSYTIHIIYNAYNCWFQKAKFPNRKFFVFVVQPPYMSTLCIAYIWWYFCIGNHYGYQNHVQNQFTTRPSLTPSPRSQISMGKWNNFFSWYPLSVTLPSFCIPSVIFIPGEKVINDQFVGSPLFPWMINMAILYTSIGKVYLM